MRISKNASVLILCFVLALAIFALGIILNYGLDFMRVEQISGVIEEHELDTESYLLHTRFMDNFGGDTCEIMKKQMFDLKKEVRMVGIEMSYYTGKTIFKRWDFEHMRRKFFILQLKFYALANKLNDRCGTSYIPLLFFYEIDDDYSERQGFVLDDVGLEYNTTVAILSFDKDYDDEPLIDAMLATYNITEFPALVIGGDIKLDGIRYFLEINDTIQSIMTELDRLNYYGYAYGQNFSYVPDAAGLNVSWLSDHIEGEMDGPVSNFAKGDMLLTKGRVLGNLDYSCEALMYYDKVETSNPELEALIYETIASMRCGRNSMGYFLMAADIWDGLNNTFRAKLDRDLAYSRDLDLRFDTSEVESSGLDIPPGFDTIIIGSSSFELDGSDILVSQVDRVNRDWLSGQMMYYPYSSQLLVTFSERLTYDEEELMADIGWHEGALIRTLEEAGVEHAIASGTVVAKSRGRWYAPNEDGVFMFEVPLDKVLYPTTRFLRDDVAIVVDTHGINMIVEQAITKGATVVIGCCDHPGKIKAAQYLSDKGIEVICPTDKYLPLILGSGASVLGSAPIRVLPNGVAIVGGQPIVIRRNDRIIAQNVSDYDSVQSYYDTPARYFSRFEEYVDLDVTYFGMDANHSMQDLIDFADYADADVVAVRVFNSTDYAYVSDWLDDDKDHRAMLFHSVSYPYGRMLLEEYPAQTSFDDINPEFG